MTGADALDPGFVYWATASGAVAGGVFRVPLNGGAVSTILRGAVAPSVLAVDTTHVYWTDGMLEESVVSIPVAGGTAATLFSGSVVEGLAVSTGSVYFWSGAGPVNLVSVPLPMGTSSNLLMSATPGPLVASGNSIYWSDATGDVVTVGADGGTVSTLAMGSASAFVAGNMASDGARVYWVEQDTSTGTASLLSLATTGGQPSTLATSFRISSVATDGSNVYYTENSNADTGDVAKVGTTGGTPTTLYAGAAGFTGVVVDAMSVYWVNTLSSTVEKLTPK